MTRPPLSGSHLAALDGLRGVAILAVLAFHLAHYAPAADGVGGAVLHLAYFGWTGVDLFFVLSGFLITGILFDSLGAENYFRAFYFRRALRIFPLYYAALSALALVVMLFAPPAERGAFADALPSLALYFANLRMWVAGTWSALPQPTAHFWSLMVEEQFYLLWPAAVALVAQRRRLLVVCGLLVVGGLAARIALLSVSPVAASTLLPARVDTLAVGAFLALWARGPAGIAPAVRWSGPVLVSTGAGLAALALMTAGPESFATYLQQSAGFTLYALFFGAVLVRSLAADPLALRWWPLAATGRISYGLYVIHYPVILLCERSGLLRWGFPTFAAAALAASFALAALSWRCFEAPILRLKARIPYSRGPASVAAGPLVQAVLPG